VIGKAWFWIPYLKMAERENSEYGRRNNDTLAVFFLIPYSSFPIQLFKLSSKRHICSLPHHNPSVLEWANRTSSQSHTHPLTWIPEFRFKMESIRFFYWLLGTGY
jgi:hypothetical protein